MGMDIEEIRRIVLPACREFGVRRLDAFGSVARGSANPESDVDLLVEFEAAEEGLAKRFFGLLHSLEDKLQCRVDLLTAGSLRNPYFRKRVQNEKVRVYER